MTDEELKARLIAPTIEDVIEPTSNPVSVAAEQVVASYQNANKWLDIIKEELLMTHGSVFFSNYIHKLAHTMPGRFDKFGDILHTADMKVPYPATNYIPYPLDDINFIFNAIFEILNSINESLRNFIKLTQDTKYHSMACAAEELLIDIDGENTNLCRIQRAYHMSNSDTIKFDKWVAHYVSNLGNLID